MGNSESSETSNSSTLVEMSSNSPKTDFSHKEEIEYVYPVFSPHKPFQHIDMDMRRYDWDGAPPNSREFRAMHSRDEDAQNVCFCFYL